MLSCQDFTNDPRMDGKDVVVGKSLVHVAHTPSLLFVLLGTSVHLSPFQVLINFMYLLL